MFFFILFFIMIRLSASIIDVPQPLKNVLCIIIFQKGDSGLDKDLDQWVFHPLQATF